MLNGLIMDSETLKRMKSLLAEECTYRLRDEVMTDFLTRMDTVKVKNRSLLIEEGTVNRDIYIVKEGILADIWLDGTNERCWAFSLPGTMRFSYPSYYFGKPAIYSLVACGETEVLHISKAEFDSLVESSHEFARWALSMAQCQIYYFEYKNSVINGDASEKFISLLKNRPEIVKKVPNKLIASYLGITQYYLSKLKRILQKP